MDLQTAKTIIRTLADGIDPTTGEVLEDKSPYNNAEVIRALFFINEQINEMNERPFNHGKPWTDELDSELKHLFSDNMSIKELAEHFHRTRGAIESELDKLGLYEKRSKPYFK